MKTSPVSTNTKGMGRVLWMAGVLAVSGCHCPRTQQTDGGKDGGLVVILGPSDAGPALKDGGRGYQLKEADPLTLCVNPPGFSPEWHGQGMELQATGVIDNPDIPGHRFPIRAFSLSGMMTADGKPITAHVDHGALLGTDVASHEVVGLAWKGAQLSAAVQCFNPTKSLPVKVRIADVKPYTVSALGASVAGLTGSAYRYRVEYYDTRIATWVNVCADPNDEAMPSAEVWGDDGRPVADPAGGFTFGCFGAAITKCYDWGYVPWRPAPAGADMTALHRACTRLVRADYCGDGSPHTTNGTCVNVWDPAGIQVRSAAPPPCPNAPAATAFAFEGAWTPDGALCLAHTRSLGTVDLDGTTCGSRPTCSSDTEARNLPGASASLLFDVSPTVAPTVQTP